MEEEVVVDHQLYQVILVDQEEALLLLTIQDLQQVELEIHHQLVLLKDLLEVILLEVHHLVGEIQVLEEEEVELVL